MDATAPAPPRMVKLNRWLPYWAVFQADLHQTLRSWVYRCWVLVSLMAAIGYLLYRFGVYKGAGIIQLASASVSDLLHWTVLGSAALIVVLTASAFSSERGTLADSVLSRGISRHQYFLGKWHARLVAVLGTFFAIGLVLIAGGSLLLHEDLSLAGGLIALATIGACMVLLVTAGITVSALSSSTVLGIAALWLLLYGCGFALSLLPTHVTLLDATLNNLPNILRGYYDGQTHLELIGWCLLGSVGIALTGMFYFSRRDV